jgi:hypothetical protein
VESETQQVLRGQLAALKQQLDLERVEKSRLLDVTSLERGDTPGGRLGVGKSKLRPSGEAPRPRVHGVGDAPPPFMFDELQRKVRAREAHAASPRTALFWGSLRTVAVGWRHAI